jgi:hypothetical protein
MATNFACDVQIVVLCLCNAPPRIRGQAKTRTKETVMPTKGGIGEQKGGIGEQGGNPFKRKGGIGEQTGKPKAKAKKKKK